MLKLLQSLLKTTLTLSFFFYISEKQSIPFAHSTRVLEAHSVPFSFSHSIFFLFTYLRVVFFSFQIKVKRSLFCLWEYCRLCVVISLFSSLPFSLSHLTFLSGLLLSTIHCDCVSLFLQISTHTIFVPFQFRSSFFFSLVTATFVSLSLSLFASRKTVSFKTRESFFFSHTLLFGV